MWISTCWVFGFPSHCNIVITLACLSSKLHLTPLLRLLQSAVTEFLSMALVTTYNIITTILLSELHSKLLSRLVQYN